jgi:basic membrane protein A and related proteins
VQLTALHPSLAKDVAAEVEAMRRAVIAGTLRPFAGRLVDHHGRVRLDGGALDDAAIASMDWFVEGVSGTLPPR